MSWTTAIYEALKVPLPEIFTLRGVQGPVQPSPIHGKHSDVSTSVCRCLFLEQTTTEKELKSFQVINVSSLNTSTQFMAWKDARSPK